MGTARRDGELKTGLCLALSTPVGVDRWERAPAAGCG
jgi:hypothetical protein